MDSRAGKFIVLFLICVFASFLTGCKGSAGKKAATEALEFIEKRGASKAGSTIEREAAQAERSAAKESEGYNGYRSRRPRHHSYDDDGSYTPQSYTVQCSQCGGSGAVYVVDYYGNIQYDYYGNPVISQCPSCGGAGTVVVSQ